MIDAINKIEDRLLFFALLVMLLLFDVFTQSGSVSELARMLMTAYAGYITGRAQNARQSQ
jgi:hypothetical protein